MSTHGLVEEREIASFMAILDSIGAAPARELLPRETLPNGAAEDDSTAGPLSCSALVQLHLDLLVMENEAQRDRLVKQKEFSMLKRLEVAATDRTPHGKLRLWVLRPAGNSGRVLPRHNIRAREPVEVIRENRADFDSNPKAVVYRVTDLELILVMNDDKTLNMSEMVDVIGSSNDLMFKDMCKVLLSLDAMSGHTGILREVLFAERPLDSAAELPAQLINANGELQLFNTGLDASQREAVEFALRQRRLAVIHGPPGTGKTTTVVETILQHLKLGHRVLACAHANMAVDNLLDRLAEANVEKMVRFGHPARIRDHLLKFSLKEVMNKCSSEAEEEEHKRKKIVTESKVVFCTLALTSQRGYLKKPEDAGAFDLVVIDECSQSVEPACWLAIQRTGKLLLAGDHCQLPPTILSLLAARRGLAISLMERQVKLHGDAAVRMLSTQYRMHELIQQWSSERLYGGKLKAAPAVRHHRLSQLPGVRETADTAPTLMLIDTAGCRLIEAAPDETGSRRNDGEADLVTAHVAALVRDGVLQHQIGVIAPYKAQATRVRAGLRQRLVGDVEVHSVDGFQGREKEAVLLSLVRSGENCSLKFVAEPRRINVAVTRARRQLVIVCDSAAMCRDEGMRSLINHVRQHGEMRSARRYVNELGAEALRTYVSDTSPGSVKVAGQAAEESAPKAVNDESTSSNVRSVSIISESATSNSGDKKCDENEQAVSNAVASMTTEITGAVCLTLDQSLDVVVDTEGDEAAKDEQAESTYIRSTKGAEQTSVVACSAVSPAAENMFAIATAIAAKRATADSATDGGNPNSDVTDPAVSSDSDSMVSALKEMVIDGTE